MKFKTTFKYLEKAAHLLPLLLFAAALMIVHREIRAHNMSDIEDFIWSMPLHTVMFAVVLSLVNYLVLGGYDYLALRYTGHKVPLPKIALVSLIGYAISNNTGHAWASGGSVRYRFYTAWGVPGWDVLKISLFLGITYMLGALTLGFGGTLMLPDQVTDNIQSPELLPWLSVACAVALAAYWLAVIFWHKPLVIRGVELRLPSLAMTLGQTIVSSLDVVLSSFILWAFLAGHVDVNFGSFLVIYVVAQVAGLLSQVPGGIGIFESAFLWLMSGLASSEQHLAVVGALVLFRIVYFFLPLLLAGICLLGYELYARRRLLAKSSAAIQEALSSFVPQVFSILVVFTGTVLLVSGAIPSVPQNMEWLQDFIPLSVVEISHMVGSLTGLLLLFLARGIWLRLDAAWYGSIIFLAIGVVASLLKGYDWEEAAVLATILALMVPAKNYFRRKSSLFAMSFGWPWLMMIFIVLAGTTWIGFFAFRHVDYADELWWQFSYKGDAPRFLRALLAMAVTITGYMLFRLTTVAKPQALTLPQHDEITIAAKLAAQEKETRGFLAVLGDKDLFWNDEKTAFIMFADTPKYWIAMGDPVGDKTAFEALLWKFREQADRFGAKAVFYQVGESCLPYYLDLGLVLLKLGEEGRLKLPDFTLEGKKRGDLRTGRNKFSRLEYSFEVLTREEVRDAMPRLREISDSWMAKKNAHEKGFSLGFFNENYITHTRAAVARDPDGKIMAFANLWETKAREEISIDLMRYDPESPSGIMDYLFAELILWSKEEKFEWFSLGMAPLSGLERRPLAPLWHKIGTAIFDLGEEFYNFEGLYEYKAKFGPQWFPRYLAAPAGLSVPLIMMNISRLIAGGWKGVFTK